MEKSGERIILPSRERERERDAFEMIAIDRAKPRNHKETFLMIFVSICREGIAYLTDYLNDYFLFNRELHMNISISLIKLEHRILFLTALRRSKMQNSFSYKI